MTTRRNRVLTSRLTARVASISLLAFCVLLIGVALPQSSPWTTPPWILVTVRSAVGQPSPVVVIDPGHQSRADLRLEPIAPGSSTMKERVAGGTTGVITRVPEYRLTLQVGLKLRNELLRRGYRVVMTRTGNNVKISNRQRALLANRIPAALVVRLHADGSTDRSKSGVSTLFPAGSGPTKAISPTSRRAAELVQTSIVKATGQKDNSLVSRSDLTGFNWSTVPVILVEMGFLSNPSEDRALNSGAFQNKLASGIAKGVEKFLRPRNVEKLGHGVTSAPKPKMTKPYLRSFQFIPI